MDKIIVDGMGGDNAPKVVVQGVVDALKDDKDIQIILTGRQEALQAELDAIGYKNDGRLEIVDCPDVIDMNDIPTEAIRKKESSLMTAFYKLKKEDDICALVTAGSTGATIAAGQLVLGRIRGIKRAALCTPIPRVGGISLLCDLGANAECKPVMLCQFALLGSAYAQVGFGIENPRVGLLNNGTEEHKGDPLRQETYQYLKKMQNINFAGNIEGRDINYGDVDVVVSDGFSGNIALKSIEGCAKMILATMKKQFTSSLPSLIGALFMKGAINRMKTELDFNRHGGAMLLGLKKVVVKSHGSSKAITITNSIKNAVSIHRKGLIQKIEENLKDVDFNALIPTDAE